jgi:hypothetical protein
MTFPLVTDRDYAKTPVNKQGESPMQEEALGDIVLLQKFSLLVIQCRADTY